MPKISKARKFRSAASLGRKTNTSTSSSTTAAAVRTAGVTIRGPSRAAEEEPLHGRTCSGDPPNSVQQQQQQPALAKVAVKNATKTTDKNAISSNKQALETSSSNSNKNSNTKKQLSEKIEPSPKQQPAPAPQSQVSRGQRKRLAKRDQYLRKEKMVLDSLKLKKAQDQAQRIDGLDAMKEALLETTTTNQSIAAAAAATTTPPRNLLRTNRGRQALMAQEVEQLNLVWQHPAYQADPLATLREHLLQSVAAANAANNNNNNEPITSKPSQHRKRHKTSKYRATRSRKR